MTPTSTDPIELSVSPYELATEVARDLGHRPAPAGERAKTERETS